ncbi:MAG TPA: AAA family ATPase [Pyrinomonadaceae bacterium]|nr:AAA family ATPase [Pyrinomonadaceae bacterium]
MNEGLTSSTGSHWRRWDPHLHAPGTLLSDQFKCDWQTYLKYIEEAATPVEGLGVTDYFSIGTYRAVREWKKQGRLKDVALIFPNVEMRLDIKTSKAKPINIHLLFSPEDQNHEAEIERILSHLRFEFRERPYQCTSDQLAALGRAYDPTQTDRQGAIRVGANQFKVTLQDLRQRFREEIWLRKNCLVAVAGSVNDGTAGLQDDDSFAATRREIESFADIIFAATPSQREFWLGKKPGADRTFIEQTYGAMKPCLHGSDAHRMNKVLEPDLDRYCWIKGDPIFETLRQAVIEPEDRVWIGPEPPAHSKPSTYLQSLETQDTAWLENAQIDLNPGMIAVIGARGSGKTALVDIIASGADSMAGSLGESSFLVRASHPVDYLEDAEVQLSWSDNSTSNAQLNPRFMFSDDETAEEVCYLSQHFVSRLCSAEGLATDLRKEIERVVFDSTDTTDRYETNSFSELTDLLLEPIRHRREQLREGIRSTSEEIVREELLRDKLGKLRKDHAALEKKTAQDRKDRKSLLPKGDEARAKRLALLEQLCTDGEAKIEKLRRCSKILDDLSSEVIYLRQHSEPDRLLSMRKRFSGAELGDDEWTAFAMDFVGDVDGIVNLAKQKVDTEIRIITEGDPSSPVDTKKDAPSTWPLVTLRAARDLIKKAVVVDANQQRKYKLLQQAITNQETSLRTLAAEIKNAEGAAERRRQLIESRRSAYVTVFGTFVEEQQMLERLYAPLQQEMKDASGALSKLRFVVRRNINFKAWIDNGEELLDLRRTPFHGYGTLSKEAEKELAQAWRTGSAEEVAAAIDNFRTQHKDALLAGMPKGLTAIEKSNWIQSLATWLYDTGHIDIRYGIEYEGVAIEQLSPGTRGIVLLLLYLAIDRQDRRPLLIDQPEENLDPKSVFEELVPHFREARKRRQVMIVTHNANLVVNTDVDQVIVATSQRTQPTGLPTISYIGGSLENRDIRNLVCRILEGGERAFLERERRYRLRWGEVLETT